MTRILSISLRGADYRGGDQPHLPRRRIQRLQGRGIDQREIIDRGESGVGQIALGIVKRRVHRLPANDCLPRLFQSPRQRHRPCRSFGRQIGVPRGKGEAIVVAHRRHASDGNAQPKVGLHPADHRQLLEILFAKEGQVGPDGREQLGDDRRDPVRNGPAERSPSHRSLTPGDADRRRKSGRIELIRASASTSRSQPWCSKQFGIVRLLPGIAIEIFIGPELQGIDEDRCDDPVRLGSLPRRSAPCARHGARPWSEPARSSAPPPARQASAGPKSLNLLMICMRFRPSVYLDRGRSYSARLWEITRGIAGHGPAALHRIRQ